MVEKNNVQNKKELNSKPQYPERSPMFENFLIVCIFAGAGLAIGVGLAAVTRIVLSFVK